MAGFGGMRKGRREAVENLGYNEEGDCPRCGGDSDSSTMAGYLRCLKCSHEWADPEYVEDKKEMEIPTYHRDAELIEQFKKDGCTNTSILAYNSACTTPHKRLDEWVGRGQFEIQKK